MNADSLNVRPPSAGLMVYGSLALLAVSAAAAYNLDYSRKELVPGYLQVEGGEVRVHAPVRGYVSFKATIGQPLSAGAPVASIQRSLSTPGGDTSVAQRAIISDKIEVLSQEFRSSDDALAGRRAALLRQRQLAQATVDQSLQEANTRRAAMALEQRKLERQEALFAQGMVSGSGLDQVKAELLSRRGELQAAERAVTQAQWQVSSLEADISALDSERASRKGSWARGKLELASAGVQVDEAERVTVKTARPAQLSTLAVSDGDTVEAGQLLAKLAPAGAKLEALLLVPPGAVARVKPGQLVSFQVEAYPYQTYGLVQGRITRVEASSVLADETSLRGEGVPAGEVVRKAYAEIETVPSAIGGLAALQSGMQLRASVEVERKSFLAWLTWPLIKNFQ